MTSWIVKKQYRNVFMSLSFKSLVHHYSLHKLRFNFFFFVIINIMQVGISWELGRCSFLATFNTT
jgi:hypothetical protein